MRKLLSELENNDAFIRRHIGPSIEQQAGMLSAIGEESLQSLISRIVPQEIRLSSPPSICDATTEEKALDELKSIATRNHSYKSWIGMGYSNVLTPPVILRNILENPGWYTAYTPYQPEVSQGRLEALLNFQHITLDLTGLDIASASLLDEATAAAEAMAMAKRISRLEEANSFFISDNLHPQIIDVICTRADSCGFGIVIDNVESVLNYNNIFLGSTPICRDYRGVKRLQLTNPYP
jgi:glycine dehydrogenase